MHCSTKFVGRVQTTPTEDDCLENNSLIHNGKLCDPIIRKNILSWHALLLCHFCLSAQYLQRFIESRSVVRTATPKYSIIFHKPAVCQPHSMPVDYLGLSLFGNYVVLAISFIRVIGFYFPLRTFRASFSGGGGGDSSVS